MFEVRRAGGRILRNAICCACVSSLYLIGAMWVDVRWTILGSGGGGVGLGVGCSRASRDSEMMEIAWSGNFCDCHAGKNVATAEPAVKWKAADATKKTMNPKSARRLALPCIMHLADP